MTAPDPDQAEKGLCSRSSTGETETLSTSTPSSGSDRSSSSLHSIWDKPMPPPPSESPQALVDFTRSPMLRYFPTTFVPLRRHATSIAEVAFLVPHHGSDLRKATVMSATFNMTATIIGGGVLSIPLSCARAGVVPFTALMVMSAVMTDFSLYILCSCARRTGSTSYGGVARAAVGPRLELASTGIIFFLVAFIVVGLMVLNMGIWTPVVVSLIAKARGRPPPPADEPTTKFQDAAVLLVALVLMFPYLLKRDLTSLRHICYVGFFSIAALCAAMVYRAAEMNLVTDPGAFRSNVRWSASSVGDVLSALPIVLLAFLCSFNIISVHCSLVEPTRDRVREVIRKSVALSFLLMYIFGLAGYLWAYDETDGNILLNFDPSDPVIFVGRIGCGITTLFALPMNLLPSREALLSLVAQVGERRAARGGGGGRGRGPASREERGHLLSRRTEGEGGVVVGNGNVAKAGAGGGGFVPLTHHHSIPSSKEVGDGGNDRVRPPPPPRPAASSAFGAPKNRAAAVEKSPLPALAAAAAVDRQDIPFRERAVHWTATFAIVAVCYVAAVLAPGVAIVWDISGSSMAFLVQFIIPAVCYIQLKNKSLHHGVVLTKNLAKAWTLLVVSSVMAVLCTTVVVRRLLSGQ